MNGVFLELLSHDFLLLEPSILLLTFVVYELLASVGGGWWILHLGVSRLGVWSCHIKHHIIEIIIVLVVFLLIIVIATSSGFRWIL